VARQTSYENKNKKKKKKHVTSKIDNFYSWSEVKHNGANVCPESNSESNKKNCYTLQSTFEGEKTVVYKRCINNIYVAFNYASIGKIIISYFCESIEQYLIKGRFFDF
jgi:hypothetical protein